MDGLKDAHREAITKVIAANDRVERAVLFGSRATGTNTVSSDVDIALFGKRLTLTDQACLDVALDEIPMAQSVDLLLYDSIQNRILREHIRQQGIEWYRRQRQIAERQPEVQTGNVVEWSERVLGELTDNFDSVRVPVKQADRVSGPYPYYGASGIVDHVDDYLLDGKYLLIAEDGENLRTRSTPIAFLAAGKFWVNNHAHVVRGNQKADTRFLMYALSKLDISGYLTGSTMPKLTQDSLNRICLWTPGLSEQRTIAHILGTLDDKMELNRRMNATLEAMARALFRSWFVDFDPVRAKMEGRDSGLPKEIADLFPDKLVASVLGEVPEGWQVKPLDSVAHFQNGLALQKFRPLGNEARLPVVKIAQLRSGEANSGEWASATIKPECIVDDGDVVFAWSGSLLVRMWCGGPAALNQHLFKVTSARYPKWYYLHSIMSHFPEFQRIAADKATTMGHIRRHHLTDALCVVPPDHVIAQVSGVLGGLLEREIVNEIATRTLATLRDALLPKLVSGELRVNGGRPVGVRGERPASNLTE